MIRDWIRDLQRAAWGYGRAVDRTATPDVVQVLDRGGRILGSLTLTALDLVDDVQPSGWDCSGGLPKYDGQPVQVSGRKLDVLRLLVASPGPVPVDQLRTAWGSYPAEEATIRWTVGELRKSLKTHFQGFEGDPIGTDGAGYTLVIR